MASSGRSGSHRPAVDDDVVEEHPERVVVVGQPDHHEPAQRPGGQVERPCLAGGELARDRRLPVRCAQTGAVQHFQGGVAGRADELIGRALVGMVGAAQNLVPVEQMGQGTVQHGDVERAGQAIADVHVVGGHVGRELVQEPQLLLPERQRKPLGGRYPGVRPDGVGRSGVGRSGVGRNCLIGHRATPSVQRRS
jgi:hypothetical protein